MQSILIKSIPALIHLLTTIFFFDFLLNDEFSFIKMGIGATVLLVTNLILTAFVADGKWKQLLISFCSFIVYFVLYVAFLILTGNPNRGSDDDPGAGVMLLLFGLPISFVCIILGTVIAIILSISFRKHIAVLKERMNKAATG